MNLRFFWEDLISYFSFFIAYLKKKTHTFGLFFEEQKDIIVSFLVMKRGRYSRPFLNTSLLLLIFIVIVSAPIIASSYPTIAADTLSQFTPPSAVVSSLSQEDYAISTQVSDKPRDKVITYTVSSGETLSSIAEKFGVSTDSIKWANNLKSDDIIAGTPIKIPPVTGVVHKVKQGETVYSIAKKYQTDAQKIVNFPFNDFADLDTFALAVGQTLIVPDGVPPAEKPPSLPPSPVPQYFAGSGTGQFIWPTTGSITQYPVWYHVALDIANSEAPNVFAADTGVVVFVQKQRYGYGWHVIVDHGNGLQTLYAHLQRIDVEVGNKVIRGQTIIGKMGSTGRSTGTHLHFEIRKNNTPVNPLAYLK